MHPKTMPWQGFAPSRFGPGGVPPGYVEVMGERDTVELLSAYVERLEARDWDGVGEVLHPDVVYRLPQTREVVTGRQAYLRWNREYPDGWHLRLAEAYGDATGGAARVEADVDGERVTALVFVRVAGGLLTQITDWWPTDYDPPPGREHLATRE
jgi:ketosteroid isomerase-like protein